MKLTLFSEDETGKRRKLKSVSVKNGSGSIEALELGTELRYLAAVESSTAKKGGGTDYSLDFACLPPSASASADLDSWRSSSAALDCYEQPSLPARASELSAGRLFGRFRLVGRDEKRERAARLIPAGR